MDTNLVKGWMQSKGVWAGIVAVYGRVTATHTIVAAPVVAAADQQAGGR